jgi:hypothetical protein
LKFRNPKIEKANPVFESENNATAIESEIITTIHQNE